MEFLIIGLVSAFNLIIIKIKLEKKRYEDAVFDLSLMVILAFLFSGSYGGMVVAMVGSLSVSLYLLVSPPRFFAGFKAAMRKELDEINKVNGIKTKTTKSETSVDLQNKVEL